MKTYDAGFAIITVIPEPDPDHIIQGLLMLLGWQVEDLKKEGKLCADGSSTEVEAIRKLLVVPKKGGEMIYAG
jgi:hypothetical protein